MAKNDKKVEETQIVKPEKAGELVVYDFGEDEGAGYENQTDKDTSLPWMIQMQSTSPLVQDGRAKPGDWLNTVTEEIFDRDKGFLYVAGTTRHYFSKWIPREKDGGPRSAGGGAFRGHLDIDDPIVLKAIEEATEFGKNFAVIDGVRLQLRETFYTYGATCNEEGEAEGGAIIAFWSTKIKAYRGWQARSKGILVPVSGGKKVRPPLYSHLVRITSKMTTNSQGTFAVPIVKPANGTVKASIIMPDDERYQMAKAVAMMVNTGAAKVNYEKQDAQNAGDDENPRPFE